jgi:hypothetical protein
MSDLMDVDQLVLLECIAHYATADLSPNMCTYRRSNLQHHVLNPTLFRSADLPQFSPETPVLSVPCRRLNNAYSPMDFMSVTQSEGTRTTYEAPVFLPADQIQVDLVPGGSAFSLAHENATDHAD